MPYATADNENKPTSRNVQVLAGAYHRCDCRTSNMADPVHNFAVASAGLVGLHVGILQSVREIPGVLALLAVYIILIILEHRLSALSVRQLGAGVAVTGLLPTFSGLVMIT